MLEFIGKNNYVEELKSQHKDVYDWVNAQYNSGLLEYDLDFNEKVLLMLNDIQHLPQHKCKITKLTI